MIEARSCWPVKLYQTAQQRCHAGEHFQKLLQLTSYAPLQLESDEELTSGLFQMLLMSILAAKDFTQLTSVYDA